TATTHHFCAHVCTRIFDLIHHATSPVGAQHAINVRPAVLLTIGDIMKLRTLTFIALALLGSEPLRAQNIQATQPAAGAEVEEIYIVRSVRESRMPPTEFCAKARTGIDDATAEDQLTLRSLTTGTSDGRVLDTNAKTIGSIRSCVGRTANPAISKFYGD